jgi:lysophospholipase L1-like esterase
VIRIDPEEIVKEPKEELKWFYEPKPNSKPKKPDYIVSINSDGLNELVDYPVENQEGTFRIIALGDSFTYGLGVNTQDTWPKQLEARLNNQTSVCKSEYKFEVINLGVYGYDIKYVVERFRKRGIKYDPSLVLWFIPPGDFLRINELALPVGEKCRANESLEDRNIDKNKGTNSCFGKAIREIYSQVGNEKMINYQKNAFREINNYYDGTLVLMGYSDTFNGYVARKVIDDFINTREGILTYDGINNLSDEDLLPNLHPNSKGYALMTNKIYDYLVKEKLVPCK